MGTPKALNLTCVVLVMFHWSTSTCAQSTTQFNGTGEDSVGYTVREKSHALTLYRSRNGRPSPTETVSLSYPVWFKFASPVETTYVIRPSNGDTIEVKKVVVGGYPDRTAKCRDTLTGVADECSYGQEYWAPITELTPGKIIPAYETGWQFDLGALVIPAKIRPERGTMPAMLESNFNIGASFQAKHRLSRYKPYYWSIVGVFSLQAVSMTSANNSAIDSASVENPAGIAYGGGLIVELSGIQFGAFAGGDAAFGDLSKTYAYNNTLWIGFGLGIGLFPKKPADAAIDAGKGKSVPH